MLKNAVDDISSVPLMPLLLAAHDFDSNAVDFITYKD